MALIQPSLEILKNRPSSFEEKMDELSSTVQEQDFHKLGNATRAPALDGNCSKSSSQTPRDSIINKQASNAYASERSSIASKPSSSSIATELKTSMKEDKLESTRAEMGEVREENERLKSVLTQMLKDYESLRSQITDAVDQQEQAKKDSGEAAGTNCPRRDMEEEAALVSLSLGTSSSSQKKGDSARSNAGGRKTGRNDVDDEEAMNGGRLTLGLDCSSTAAVHHRPPSRSSPENSSEDVQKGRDDGEPWQPGKILKSPRSGDDEVSQQVNIKKARVSVRARCDAPTMSDGCQWRKYGQKISKGNPCPRAYYRCTVAPACPVRKQVQRCAEDVSILITTYEGTHNHPLPMAATAMASTTAAAANMLMSGSSTSARPGAEAPLAISSSMASTAAHHGLSFNLADSSVPRQYYLPTNPAINASPLYPTITLDLTSPSSSSSSANATATQFNRFAAGNNTYTAAPGYTTASFNFSSMDSTTSAASPWSTNSTINGGYLGYGSTNPYNNNNIAGRPTPQGQGFYNQPSYLQKTTMAAPASTSAPTQNNTALTDTIAKAITTDPSFQSALAAAITSIVAGRSQGKEAGSEGLGQNLRWGSSVSSTSTGGANGSSATGSAATSYMNRTGGFGASPQQGGSLMFLQPPLGFSDAKNKSAASPFDREHGA